MLVQAELVSLLNEVINQTAKLRKGGTEATYFCKCGHYKRKLEVLLEPPFFFHCWVCSSSGNLYTLLKFYKANKSCYDRLYKLTGDIRLNKRKKKDTPEEIVLPDEFHSLALPIDSPEYKNALFYLKKRGLTAEDILRYNIGYCESGPYDGYVIIPSYDAGGKLNFFIGRRYYNIEKVIPHKKPEVSMNLIGFECFINYNEPLNLVEGVFDAIAVRNNAIPLFGKYLQPKLKEAIIINKVKRVNIILDNDALNDAIENYKYLKRLGIKVHVIKLDGKDPSVLGYTRIHSLIRESKPFEFEDLISYKIGL